MNETTAEAEIHKNHDIYFVPGLQRGLRVLEIVAAKARPVSVAEIASDLGLTRSSVFRLVYTLRHMGFLEEAEHGKLLTLGPRVLNIGFAFLASRDIIEVSRPALEELRDTTNVSAHLAIRDERDVLYLSCVQTRSGFLSNMNVGARAPAYASPMGWVLLAGIPERDLTKLFARQSFSMITEQTPRNLDALIERVAEAHDKGYVLSRGALEAGGSSISAPVFNEDGQVVAAIDISGPDSAFDLGAFDSRYVPAVIVTARKISAQLGYRAAVAKVA